MTEPTPPSQHWTLDKRVPIATLVTVFVQIIGFAVWISSTTAAINARLEHLEQAGAAVSSTFSALRIDARMSVVEAQLGDVKAIAQRLEDRLFPISSRAMGHP